MLVAICISSTLLFSISSTSALLSELSWGWGRTFLGRDVTAKLFCRDTEAGGKCYVKELRNLADYDTS